MTDRFERWRCTPARQPTRSGAGRLALEQDERDFGGRRRQAARGRRTKTTGRGNPHARLGGRDAELEGGTHGLAYASGLAATQNVLYLLDAGDRLILSDDAYGGTWRLASKVWSRYGVLTEAVDLRDHDALAAALGGTPAPRMVWVETPTNAPKGAV